MCRINDGNSSGLKTNEKYIALNKIFTASKQSKERVRIFLEWAHVVGVTCKLVTKGLEKFIQNIFIH